MRTSRILLIAMLLPAGCMLAQAPLGPPPLQAQRPFGKYLAGICTIRPEERSVTCRRPQDEPPPDPRTPQNIQLKLVCAPGAPTSCKPPYPTAPGADFYVEGTADSGLPVTQTVLSGAVTPAGGTGTVHYHVDGAGTIAIRATQQPAPGAPANPQYRPAAPLEFALPVAGKAGGCDLFPADDPDAQPVAAIDAPGIVTLLGNPVPFVLAAQGSTTILIYSTRMPAGPPAPSVPPAVAREEAEEQAVFASLQPQIAALLGRSAGELGLTPATPFAVELTIPHAPALGDLATRLATLNYSQFTIQDVGKDKVRVTAPQRPDCGVWRAFLNDVRQNAWQISPEPLNLRLFYLANSNGATYTAAPDVVTAFNNLAPASTAAAGGSTSSSGSSTAGGGTSSAPAASPSPSTANISIAQPPGSVIAVRSDTTPCVAAGLAVGNASACAPAAAAGTTTTTPASSAAPAPKPPLGMSSLGTDQLLFSMTNPGDEAQVQERKRMLALLDLPRPEMILNGWVIQNSSASKEAMGEFNGIVKETVSSFNEGLERVMLQGWRSLKNQIAQGSYFNEPFYHYISDRFVTDTHSDQTAANAQEAAQRALDHNPAQLLAPGDGSWSDLGICDPGHYCLGYAAIFNPVKPRLTDILLTIAAARHPVQAALISADFAEGTAPVPGLPRGICESLRGERRDRCNSIFESVGMRRILSPADAPSCDSEDILYAFRANASAALPAPPRMFLRCFKQVAQTYLADASPANPAPSGAGLLRAAIANFLFHYKISNQYPHEFEAYELSQSADALNAALSPLIDAFNRDVTAFQQYLRAVVEYNVERSNREHDGRCCIKRFFGLDKPSFFNDGIVTVRTISGQWTGVLSTSQSFLNASSAPEISTFLNNLPGGTAAAATVPQAVANAASAYQTTYAQIGRSLAITAIPRSLASASSAEIIVSLNADESAAPTYWGGSQNGTQVNLSRVSQHDTSTRVRVESVKLFEISSLTAALQRSQSRFPLLPPFLQLPFIGTIAGIPLPPAREYHSSTAILSAIVVPTAADLAYGLEFLNDAVAEGAPGAKSCTYRPREAAGDVQACHLRSAVSLKDFDEPVGSYNRAIVHCFATDGQAPFSALQPAGGAQYGCRNLSFDELPR